MACSCEIFTIPVLDVNFQEHGSRRNAAGSILPHFVISSFPADLFLSHAEALRVFTFSEPCILQYMYVRKTNKMHTLFPLFVSIILSSTCFELISSSAGGHFCKISDCTSYILYMHGKYYMLLVQK